MSARRFRGESRLRELIAEAVGNGPDPLARLMSAQRRHYFDVVEKAAKEATAISDKAGVPEWEASFRERYAHVEAATVLYTILVERGQKTHDVAAAVEDILLGQAARVHNYDGMFHAAEEVELRKRLFAITSAATTMFITGIHTLNVNQDQAAKLAGELTDD